MRQQRRHGGGVDVGARALHQPLDQRRLARHKCAEHTGRLTQRAHVNNARMINVEMLQHAAAMLAQHAKTMRIVEQQPCVMTLGQCEQFRHRRNIAIHAEHRVHRNQLALGFAGREQMFQLCKIIVCITFELRARQHAGVVERGVIQPVGKHGVITPQQCSDHAQVSHVAGGKQQCARQLHKRSERLFQRLVCARMA